MHVNLSLSLSICVCVHIYIYILRVSLLRVLESNFPEDRAALVLVVDDVQDGRDSVTSGILYSSYRYRDSTTYIIVIVVNSCDNNTTYNTNIDSC